MLSTSPTIISPTPGRIASSPLAKWFQCGCAIGGMLTPIMLIISFAAAGFLPPKGPTWTADRTVEHYQHHIAGVHTASIILMLASLFYLFFTASLSAQMRRIPNLHPAFSNLQTVAGTVAAGTFITPSMILAAITYRLERPAETTQLMSDYFWMSAMMPWAPFAAQNIALSSAILTDTRERPLFPKTVAYINLFVALLYFPTLALHCVKTNALAWDGEYSFWVVGFIAGWQINLDGFCLLRVVLSDKGEDVDSLILS